jgi:N-methylhydantoinase A
MGKFLAEAGHFQDVVTCDIGGTSVDIGVLKDRTISTTNESVIGDQKNAIETMDIPSIGAGGGSIAWIDNLGVLRVGPSSAGAEPGPACYGKGGREATVTDANVQLGYIPTDYFLGGSILLKADLAEKAIEEKIAKPLGLDTVEAAYAISSLAETLTAEKIFLTIVEKGYDPRDFVFVAAGGAGPVHAIAMAMKLGMKKAYIPKHAAVFSAFGGAVADFGHVLNRFFYKRDDQADAKEVTRVFRSLEKEAVDMLKRQGVQQKNMALVRGAEMRYFGQLRDINVSLPEARKGEGVSDQTFKDLVKSFHERHEALYGWGDPKLPVIMAILKVRGIGKRPRFVLKKQRLTAKDPSRALKRTRRV